MLENLFTNVFGRPKNKVSNRQSNDSSAGQNSGPPQMTGPFSTSVPQMPQPPHFSYPAAPYPSSNPSSANPALYPSLPFSQHPAAPGPYGVPAGGSNQPYNYPTGTLAAQASPLDSVPFEIKFSLGNSTNLVTLDQLFKDIKVAADVVDRADAYLRSGQSDYDFKTEQGLIYQ